MAQYAEKTRHMTPAEYAAMERTSQTKHEYFRGRVYAMSGADPKHNLVCANLIRALGNRLGDGPCVLLTSDQSVYIEASDLGTYPDVVVFCGHAKMHPDFTRSLVNPSILIEVLSPSTERYDRGEKFEHYRQIESLKEYVLVSTDRRAVDHYLREANGKWTLTTARGKDAEVRFPSVDATVTLTEIYANIERVVAEELAELDSEWPPVTREEA